MLSKLELESKYKSEVQEGVKLDEYVYKNHSNEMFTNMTQFIESMICESHNIVYTCDKNLLTFYANHWATKGERVLLVYLNRINILAKTKPSVYGDKLRSFVKMLDGMKLNDESNRNLKIIVWDSNNCIPAFKIDATQESDMILRYYSNDAMIHKTTGTVVSRYADDVDESISDPNQFTYLEAGIENKIDWNGSLDETKQVVEDFLKQSKEAWEKAIEGKH